MRERKEIEQEYSEFGYADFEVILEVLLDIRDILTKPLPVEE